VSGAFTTEKAEAPRDLVSQEAQFPQMNIGERNKVVGISPF
jgi:hypothetical protein